MTHCVPCTQEHIDQLKPRIRESDQNELRLSSGRSPEVSLQLSFEYSLECFAVIKKGVVLCVFGVCPHRARDQVGVPWLICAEEFKTEVGPKFAFQCRKYVKRMLAPFSSLMNSVWVENKEAISWLQWMGFHIQPPIKYGPMGSYFYPFVLNKDINYV